MRHHHVNILYVVLVVLTLFLYAGCTGGGFSASNYRSGSQGLEMTLHSSNPTVLYEGDQLSWLLEVRNRGTTDVDADSKAYVYVSGYDPNYVQGIEVKYGISGSTNTLVLDGKSEFDPTGENAQVLTIESNPLFLPNYVDEYPQSIQFDLCYEYKTLATAEVCVDPDPYNRRLDNKVCSLSATNYGAQGHPVVISSITPTVSSKGRNANDISFAITFSNAGGGQVFSYQKSGIEQSCVGGFDREDEDMVRVQSVMLGKAKLECEPAGDVRLIGGTGKIMCTCDSNVHRNGCLQDTPYKTTMQIELVYGYKQSIQSQFIVYKS